jgi:hypothetical protein
MTFAGFVIRTSFSKVFSITEMGIPMVARNIRCTVVAVTVSDEHCTTRGALARDILPGADPYVAQLIRKLQDEVREERRLQTLVHTRQRFQVVDASDSFRTN